MLQGQKLRTPTGVQALLFPMEVMTISQGVNDPFSHAGTMNIDLSGKDGGSDPVFAPADITVKWFGGDSNGIIVWTNEPVLFADGTVDYASIRILHNNDISYLKVGQVFAQGDVFYHEGVAGWATGNHIHFNVAKGRTTTLIKHTEVANGYSDLKGSVHPASALFVNNTTIKQGLGYPWKTYTAPAFAPMVDTANKVYKTGTDGVWIRQLPSTDYPKLGLFPKLTQATITQISTAKANGYDWVKLTYGEFTGYCAIVEGSAVQEVLTPMQIMEKALQEANAKIKEQEALIALQKTRIASLEAEIASYVKVEKVLYEKV